MDKAKAAVQNIVGKSGHHDTTVHESVAPAVTHENITKQRHEEVQKAVDREIHQDHYHTTVQPVKDREVLPEQHQHRQANTEHHEHHHGKERAIADSLKQERAHFQDQTTEGRTTESHSTLPTVTGEHKHHHVHETIQPVVQKETIQPSVIHTTVPVHEVHHNDPKHHAASALPAVSLADFKKQGGSLTGRAERSDAFAGEPNTLASTGSAAAHSSGSHGTNTGPHSSNLLNKADPRVDSDRDGSANAGLAKTSAPVGSNTSSHGTTGLGSSGTHGTTGLGSTGSHGTTGLGSTGTHGTTGLGSTGTHGTTGYGNSSTTGSGIGSGTSGPHSSNLANKADPRVDSDRDGSNNAGLSSGTGYGSSTTGTTGIGSGAGTHGTHGTTGTGAGPHTSGLGNKVDPRVDSDTGASRGTTGTGSGLTGTHGTTGTGSGLTGSHPTSHGSGLTGTGSTPGSTGTGITGTHGTTGSHNPVTGTSTNTSTTTTTSGEPKKVSLLDKLNPKKDSDGDGKAGFFS